MKNKKGSLFLTIIMVLAIAIVVILAGLRLCGLEMYSVLSGSMEPVYHTGSVIYVKPVETDTLKEGDVITFMLDEKTVVTHRIVEVVPDEEDPDTLRFRTKGDANDVVDGKLTLDKNVIGVPIFTVPYLGYLASFMQTTSGKCTAVLIGIILIILIMLPDGNKEKKPSSKKGKEGRNV